MTWENKIKTMLNCSISKYSVSKEDEFLIADLESHFDPERPAYLYFVFARNRVTVNPEYLTYNDKFIEVEIFIQDKNKIVKEILQIENLLPNSKKLQLESEFPFNKFKISDENGKEAISGKAIYLAELLWEQLTNKHLLDYEIKYIGQSTTSKNNTPVVDRVSYHKKYQEILSDYNSQHLDKELQFLFCSLKIDALFDFPEAPIERDIFSKNLINLVFTPSAKNRKKQVTLIEAALINYFKPQYNTDYKNDYPNTKHIAYNDYYSVNMKTLSILIGLNGLSPRLYTETIQRNNEFRFSFDFTPQS